MIFLVTKLGICMLCAKLHVSIDFGSEDGRGAIRAWARFTTVHVHHSLFVCLSLFYLTALFVARIFVEYLFIYLLFIRQSLHHNKTTHG